MYFIRYVFFTIILFCTSLVKADSDVTNRTIVVLGDSISAGYGINVEMGWVNLLQQHLNTHMLSFAVQNQSVSGDTTANGLNRLDAILEKYDPSAVIVELGGNDGLRGQPLNEIKDNLTLIIKQIKAFDKNTKILLLGMKLPINYGRRYTENFHKIYKDLYLEFGQEEQGIYLVDFFMENIADDATLMQNDKIHPTQTAQSLLLQNALPEIQNMLNDI